MDATALRWVLGIIGVVFIAGIYLYSLYQGKLRRQASAKTFTHDDMASDFIEDEALRKELSNINTMLEQEIQAEELDDIKINPGLETKDNYEPEEKPELVMPKQVCTLFPEQRIVHILKPNDGHLLTAEELINAFVHAGFELNEDNRYQLEDQPNAHFQLLNLTESGSFQGINETHFTTQGLVCCIFIDDCKQPLVNYDTMLKKVDELVRILDLKVYNQEFELLTLQHVTDIRKNMISASEAGPD